MGVMLRCGEEQSALRRFLQHPQTFFDEMYVIDFRFEAFFTTFEWLAIRKKLFGVSRYLSAFSKVCKMLQIS